MKKKKVFQFGCLMLLVMPLNLLKGETRIEPVNHVTLYLDGARLSRQVTVENPDEHIRILGLPRDLDPGSIYLNVANDKEVLIQDIQFREVPMEELPDSKEVVKLEAELSSLRASMRGIENERARRSLESEQLDALEESLLNAYEKNPTEEVRTSLEDVFRRRQTMLDETHSKEAEWSKRTEVLQEKLEKVEQRLAKAERIMQSLAGELMVEISKSTSVNRLQMELSYQVDSASWSPTYILRAEPGANELRLEARANITNQGIEDWNNVVLALMTSRPVYRGMIPEIPPVFLSNRKEGSFRDSLSFSSGIYSEQLEAKSVRAAPKIERGTTAFRVTLQNAVSIPAEIRNHAVTIMSQTTETSFFSVTAPVVSLDAYLQAEVKNPFPFPVLPGVAELFVDGIRTGRDHLESVNPGEETTLGFGINPNIEIDRKQLVVSSGERGLFGSKRVFTRHYETRITNQMPVQHALIFKDRVPVSQNEKIEVELEEPRGVEPEQESGIFDMELQLPPHGEKLISTKFKVTTPEDFDIPTWF